MSHGEKKSSTPETSNKMTHGANQKIHGTKEKEMKVMVPGRRSLMMAMAIGSIPATGMGKKKADGNCQWEEQPSTYKRKKTNADHDSSYNNVMPSSGNAWNAGDGIGKPNAKSNAGSSWVRKIRWSLMSI